jgi:hypothetical protein
MAGFVAERSGSLTVTERTKHSHVDPDQSVHNLNRRLPGKLDQGPHPHTGNTLGFRLSRCDTNP